MLGLAAMSRLTNFKPVKLAKGARSDLQPLEHLVKCIFKPDYRKCIFLLVVVSQSADSTAVGTGLPTLYVPGWSTCGTAEPWVQGTMQSERRSRTTTYNIQLPLFSFELTKVYNDSERKLKINFRG